MYVCACVFTNFSGETEENKAHVIQGQTDTKLNQVGREQGRLVGVRLSAETFTSVYSSDLARAKDVRFLLGLCRYAVS